MKTWCVVYRLIPVLNACRNRDKYTIMITKSLEEQNLGGLRRHHQYATLYDANNTPVPVRIQTSLFAVLPTLKIDRSYGSGSITITLIQRVTSVVWINDINIMSKHIYTYSSHCILAVNPPKLYKENRHFCHFISVIHHGLFGTFRLAAACIRRIASR